MPNFIEIEELFVDGQTFETGFIRSTLSQSRIKMFFWGQWQ